MPETETTSIYAGATGNCICQKCRTISRFRARDSRNYFPASPIFEVRRYLRAESSFIARFGHLVLRFTRRGSKRLCHSSSLNPSTMCSRMAFLSYRPCSDRTHELPRPFIPSSLNSACLTCPAEGRWLPRLDQHSSSSFTQSSTLCSGIGDPGMSHVRVTDQPLHPVCGVR
jgi:hypothetical protein